MTQKLPMQACLACGHKMDRHSQVDTPGTTEAGPEPDDITLCIRCGFVMAYDKKLRFRQLTQSEVYKVARDKRVQDTIAAIGQLPWQPPRQ